MKRDDLRPVTMLDELYDYLSDRLPKASEAQLQAAVKILDESARRADNMEPAFARFEAKQAAAELKALFEDAAS